MATGYRSRCSNRRPEPNSHLGFYLHFVVLLGSFINSNCQLYCRWSGRDLRANFCGHDFLATEIYFFADVCEF